MEILGRFSMGQNFGFNMGTLSVNTSITTSYAFGSWMLNRQIQSKYVVSFFPEVDKPPILRMRGGYNHVHRQFQAIPLDMKIEISPRLSDRVEI